jgi:signal transduction histidine kinase
MTPTQETDLILIVDDSPADLEVLSKTLTDAGFEIAIAIDGESALEQVGYELPTLILLDVLLPGIDGFETCRRLKMNSLTQEIPIIFLTVLDDTLDKIKGLNLGAVDYISKPFQQEEVLARVRVQLKLYSLTKTLERQNTQLKQEVEQRTAAEAALQKLTVDLEKRVEERTAKLKQTLSELQQTQMRLVQSEKMYSLGKMVAGIAHELNNPVSFIDGNLVYALHYIDGLLELLHLYIKHYQNPVPEIQEKAEKIDLDFVMRDLPKLLNSMQVGTERIAKIVRSLRNFSHLDQADKKAVDLHQSLDNTLLILQHRLKPTSQFPGIQILKEYGNLPLVECYPGQLNQVFMNILSNAIEALEESVINEQGTERLDKEIPKIEIRTEATNDKVTIRFADNGPGMSQTVYDRLFDPFFTTKSFGKGTGLGLAISYQIVVEKHGGRLHCVSTLGEGAEFIIEIPLPELPEAD